MSSMFELDERIHRLRETLSYLRAATLSDAAEIKSAAQSREDWLKFVAELRDFFSATQTLAPRRTARRSAARKPPGSREIAENFRAGATLH
jgi:hypothetical protein